MQDIKSSKDNSHQHSVDAAIYREEESITPAKQKRLFLSTVDSVLTHGDEHHKNQPPKVSLKQVENGVCVERAEAYFAELKHDFSNFKHQNRNPFQTNNRRNNGVRNDIEKDAAASSDSDREPFDLEQTLRGNKEQDTAYGIKSKRIGVLWDKLTVTSNGGARERVKTFPDAFIDFFNVPAMIMSLLGIGKKGKEFDILRDFKGVVKPGEMVLVLGKPGAGCTTFLKLITNQRHGYTNIKGDVFYGPFDSKTFGQRFRGEAVYNPEEDVHLPTLTVGQTLGFALDTRTPGTRPQGVSKKDFKKKVIDLLLRMFNIEHTINGIVGNSSVRGISGGERKRVSIAEVMITNATVCGWDNPTRGLDASTAADCAKCLRIVTNVYSTTTFVSLHQASQSIYEQFDKVMVIDKGRQVFFGPAKEARAYFEGLGFKEKPRQTTPDYLTGCTDSFEREYKDGMSDANAPSDAASLVRAFDESIYSTRLSEEIRAYKQQLVDEKAVFADFEAAHEDAKQSHTGKSSDYAISFHTQVWVLMQRQFLLKWQDKSSLAVSWITSIGLAIILGTVYLDSPQTSVGAFPRGGLLFTSVLFNSFQALAELASTMMGRDILSKHRAYAFHRPSALAIGQIVVDLAFASVQIFVFSIIVYFMGGLVRDAGAFFTFVLTIISTYLSMALFFRLVGSLSKDFDVAMKFASVVITLYVLTSGYTIQYHSIKAWLRWIFYINSLGLGFSTLMMNEFKRISLTCVAMNLIPYGPSYSSLVHQVCTLPGGAAGTNIISGSSYVLRMFAYNPSDLWRNWGILIVLIVVYFFLNLTLGESLQYGAAGKTTTVFAHEDKELKELNDALGKKREKRTTKELQRSSDLHIESKAVLTWENLCYDAPVPSGHIRLLNEVSGYVKPGTLTALMGPSSAGKTLLLDILAGRKNVGIITGQVLMDGVVPGFAFQRGTAYAEQLDALEATSTVREAFRFSAQLRQPYEIPLSEKFEHVEEIIALLEMEDIADAIIGNPGAGLAVEQRKRVTIGIELAAKPELLLFLDEPTSGLDSQSAWNIIRFLRKLAAAGQAILCTIHQPNAALFASFDRLLLLQKGGETVYFGDVGEDASTLLEYFLRNGANCPGDANPAEWVLDVIGAGQSPRIGDRDWGEIWTDSPELAVTKIEINKLKDQRLQEAGTDRNMDQKEYASPLWYQIRVVVRRTNLSYWRSPDYGFTRFFNAFSIALITGLTYLNLNDSRSSLQYRVFTLFQATVIPALTLTQVEPRYQTARMLFYRESATKAYSQFPFALSMVLAEIPYSLLCTLSFFLPIYYLAGFQRAADRAGFNFFVILIMELFSVTLGQMIAALTPTPPIAALFTPFFVIIFGLFCGVTVPKPSIPKFWRVWLYQIDPLTRLTGSLITTELEGRAVRCTATEYNTFTSPPGQDCGTYMAPFFAAGNPGYLAENATNACQYCAYKVGNEFFEPLGFSFAHRWRDLGILAAFVGSNLILLFLGSRYLNYNRR